MIDIWTISRGLTREKGDAGPSEDSTRNEFPNMPWKALHLTECKKDLYGKVLFKCKTRTLKETKKEQRRAYKLGPGHGSHHISKIEGTIPSVNTSIFPRKPERGECNLPSKPTII